MYGFWRWIINFSLKRIEQDSGLVSHAKREFAALGYDLDDKEEGPNKWIMENVISLLSLFGSQGHSVSSAPLCVSYFKDLASWKPLGPLTGEDTEWREAGDDYWQNTRCSHVFKKDGQAYDSEGKIFREPNGSCYQNAESRVNITFPYTPTREYVDVPS